MLLEGFAAALSVKRAAEDQHSVLEKNPRASRGGLVIENAGIVGICFSCGEPLLYGDVFLELLLLKKRHADVARCTVCANHPLTAQLFAADELYFISRVGFCDFFASTADLIHSPRDQALEKGVKPLAIDVHIASAVMSDEIIGKVYRPHRKKLGRGKDLLRQTEIIACENILRVGGEQASADLVVIGRAVDYQGFIFFGVQKSRKIRARRACADNYNVIFLHVSPPLAFFLGLFQLYHPRLTVSTTFDGGQHDICKKFYSTARYDKICARGVIECIRTTLTGGKKTERKDFF